ncbi:hypothetical protein K2X05_09840, partial [bacterium]|nr:hypothetical protein [bacterium]
MSDALTQKLAYVIQKIFWPLVGVAALSIVASFAMSYKKNQDLKKIVKAQDELFVIRKEVEKVASSFEPKEDPKKDPKKPAKEAPKQSPEVLEAAYSPLVQKLQAYINANQGTQPAVEAALLV